jgi:sugar O-acyltransferase (sialic acid O-acetyltransferase NeuD family)
MEKELIIIGSGGFAKEVFTIIVDCGRLNSFIGFFEPDKVLENRFSPKTLGFPCYGYSQIDTKIHKAIIAVGDPVTREKIVNELPTDLEYLTLFHPKANISEWVEIAEGAIICAGTILTVDINLGKHAHLNLNTTIGHDCEIGNYFTTAPNVNVSGNCKIGNHVYLGTASCIKQGITIVDNVVVGMGAVVTKDILEPGIYIGNPLKKLEK